MKASSKPAGAFVSGALAFVRDAFYRMQRSPAFTGLVLFVIVVILNVIVQGPARFFTVKNISLLFAKNAPLVLVTMGQLMLMLLGIIDISIGVQMSFVNVLAVTLPMRFTGIPLPLAWGIALLAVVGIATVHGTIVSLLRIPPC
ncbi:MAG: hypothetical protein LBT87_08040 [Treponema sp.]|jgi:ribose/xylose/arabinose/galactoside ABC-type transport system permease subunit|nr:hypothetical protein [Treponema sp.]